MTECVGMNFVIFLPLTHSSGIVCISSVTGDGCALCTNILCFRMAILTVNLPTDSVVVGSLLLTMFVGGGGGLCLVLVL